MTLPLEEINAVLSAPGRIRRPRPRLVPGGTRGELHATLAAQHITATGPGGGIYQTEIVTDERGEATIFLPCQAPPQPMGRVTALDVPAAELAIVIHAGPHVGIDLAYGIHAANARICRKRRPLINSRVSSRREPLAVSVQTCSELNDLCAGP